MESAPGELELVREFVNTRELEPPSDVLDDAGDATAWLIAHGIPAGEALDGGDLARLRAVREGLRALLEANNTGEAPPVEALGALNRESSEAAVGLRFDQRGSALVTHCRGVASVIARLLAIVHGAMEDGTWRRLKSCQAHDCVWAFYDHSRNRSGAWCSMEGCGNRAKARAYRERQRAQTGR